MVDVTVPVARAVSMLAVIPELKAPFRLVRRTLPTKGILAYNDAEIESSGSIEPASWVEHWIDA